jgi:hypothetical protein
MNAPEDEREAVRTTIVGGRPPGSGRSNITVPRGIEVLVKKAAVDPEFCELLFAQRGAAAAAIELELDPAENAMLSAIPQEQLTQIVRQTTVPVEQRRVFLGRLAVAMLAVLGGGLAGCESVTPHTISAGIQPLPPRPEPDTSGPSPSMGIRPDPPLPQVTATNRPVPPPTRGIQPDQP